LQPSAARCVFRTPCPCFAFVSNNSQICSVPQAELASIHSSEEQTFLISSIRNSEQYTANIFYWLGGQVAAKGGHLNWTDNTPATYTGKDYKFRIAAKMTIKNRHTALKSDIVSSQVNTRNLFILNILLYSCKNKLLYIKI
jgi:Lectin C-type domain